MQSIVGKPIFLILCLLIGYYQACAQLGRKGPETITYEEVYDDPYDISTLFVHFQPLYGELFTSNVNLGFGIQAQYYMNKKLDFFAHARKPWLKSLDFARDLASKNEGIENTPEVFNYYELGGTYHIIDREQSTETKMILYSSRYEGRKWASTVPKHTIIPSKVRKIYGARLGGIYFDTTTDLGRAIDGQKDIKLVDENNTPIEDYIPPNENLYIYSNLYVASVFVGASLALIKNLAIKPDKGYSTLVNDLMFTAYADIMIAPYISLDDIYYQDTKFSTENVKTLFIGGRVGMEGKFNRKFGWSYGAEIGYRPGILNRGFFAMAKISFPVFSTKLDYAIEAFGK